MAYSERKLIHIAPDKVGIFRQLLESYENIALFTVLERKTAILKLMFSKDQEYIVEKTLKNIQSTVPFNISQWPFNDHTKK